MKRTLELAKPTLLIAAVLLVGAASPPALLAQNIPGSLSPYSTLIDINFGAHQSPGLDGIKVGLAATGQSTNDFWNFYSRDDGHGHWLVDGALSGLKFADGSVSAAGLMVSNAPGCWGDGSSDAMYNTYVYPFDGGNITVMVTNLAVGKYDLYVYGPDGNYELKVGPTNYGVKTTWDQPVVSPPLWQEGRQYALYRGVSVGAGQGVVLTVRPGVGGYAVISGLQITSATVVTGTAPSIVTQPQSQTVLAGSSVTFTVAATGTAPLSYQWRFGGTNIAGATGTALTLSNVRAAQAGNYGVQVTNLYGVALSSNATLAVRVPACVAPPSGLVGWWGAEGNGNDSAGANNAYGLPNISFTNGIVGQAFACDPENNPYGTYTGVQIADQPAYALTNSLSIEGWIRPRGPGYVIFFRGDDRVGLDSYAMGMGLNNIISFGITDANGNSASVSAPLVYNQWWYVAGTLDGASGKLSLYTNGILAAQITTTVRPFGNLIPQDSPGIGIGNVNDGFNNFPFKGDIDEISLYSRALSAVEVQAIYNAGSAGKCKPAPPTILTQPQSQTVGVGSNVTFTVAASGTAPLSYQWRFNGTNISAATASALTLSNVQLAQAGSYTVRVTNLYGSATSSNAILTVNSAAACAPPPSGMVSWWRSEGTADDSIGVASGTLYGGVAFAPGRVGQCFAFNGVNGVVSMSDIPALALTNSLAIECWLFVTNAPSTVGVVIFRGDTRSGLDPYYVTLEPRAGTSGVLNFVVWGADNINASISAPMPLGAWTHLAATLDDATGLMKLYTNAVVAAQTTTTIRPLGPLDPNYQPGVGIGNVSHQPGPFNYPFRGRIDELSVYSRALSASEIAAIYNAGASGKCPLGVPPSITAQPASQSVLAGSAVTFTVTATGTSPLSYQWRFNGTNNAGATGTSLSLSNVQPAQAGAYAVQISNAYGSTNSANALLTVNTSPSCVTPPSGLVGWWAAEGNALDSIGTNNGTLHNGVGFEFGGGVGWAFSFNGTNSYVGVPDSSALRLTNELTIEFWVKRQDLQANDAIVEKGGDWTRGVQNYGVTLAGSQYGNDLAFLFAGGTRHASGITDLNWHHVAVVARNGAADPTFYVDGVARPVISRQGPATLVLYPSTAPLHIGAQVDPISGWFYYSKAFVDEVSLYSRALSAVEVQAIYNAGSAGKCKPAPPTILTQPQSQTVAVGASVSLSAVAAGTPPLSYQWWWNGTNIDGATGTSLSLSNVQPAQAGNYALRVTNAYGSITTSNALLTVILPPSCVTPPSGLVGWWRAEANAVDQAGTNNGTLVGNPTYGAGRVGQAFVFDSRGDAVAVGNPTNLQLQNFTIEAWIKRANGSLASLGGEGAGHIFGGSYGGYVLGLWDDGRLSLGQIGIGGVESARAITDTNSYHHVAVTKNGSTVVFYVDGAGETAAAYNPGFVFNGGFVIGARGVDYGASFLGSLDEVSIYNRALSVVEIQSIYNADGAGKCTGPTAPFINAQPANQTVSMGGTATFTVVAGGKAPLSYQWQFNGTNILAATATALTLTNVQLAQAGSYTVRVTNLYGSATSSNAILTVNPAVTCVPPPSGLVGWWAGEGNALDSFGTNSGVLHNGVGFASGKVGQAFIFNGTNSYVEVPDSPALRLTNELTIEFWVQRQDLQANDAIVEKGGDWTRGVQNYGVTLASSQYGNDLAFLFAGGTRHASGITDLNWHHIAVVARNGAADPTFYVDGVLRPVTSRQGPATLILYPSTAPLHIAAQVDPISGWYYYSKAFVDEVSLYNRALAAAEIQTLYNAGSAGKCPAGVAPSIITQPASQTVLAGSSVTFTVSAAGTPPLGYQWRFGGTNIAGATRTSLSLSNVQPAQAGNYLVVVTNVLGSIISSNALLTVNATQPCTPPPSGLVSWWRGEGNAVDSLGSNSGVLHNGVGFASGKVGQAFIFNGTNSYVEVPDSPALRLTNELTIEFWVRRQDLQANDAIVEKGGDWTRGVQNYGVTLASSQYGNDLAFLFAGGTRHSSGLTDLNWHHVAVVARNGAADPTFYVDGVARPVTSRQGPATLILYPSAAPLHIGAQVDPLSGWFYYSKAIVDETSIYSRALSATEVQAIYNAGVSGKCGTGVPPFISVQPTSQTVPLAANVTFSAAAGGTPPLSYQWQFNGNNIFGATGTSLSLSNVQPAQAGNYALRVTNYFGSISSSNAALVVTGTPPRIVTQPQSQTVEVGSNVTFTVAATGTAPLSYQWRLGGTNLAGATTSSLVLANVQLANAGNYSVRVTNAFGSIFSSNATLTVLQGAPKTLINVDFGAGPATSGSRKAGPAAVGQATNDFWNFYTRDDDSGGWRTFGVLSNLKFANGAVSSGGMTVLNAPGAWADGSSDPMYNLYIYPFDGSNVTVTVTNLAAGQYDFYLYGPDGNYQLAVGPALYGIKTTWDQSVINPPLWQEGRQYALYRGVSVGAGQGVILTVRPGVGGYAVISGLQIASPAAAGQFQRQTAQLMLRSLPSASSGSQMQLELLGAPNRVYVVQASTTLMEWATIGLCVTDANGSVTLFDLDADKYSARLYRLVGQ